MLTFPSFFGDSWRLGTLAKCTGEGWIGDNGKDWSALVTGGKVWLNGEAVLPAFSCGKIRMVEDGTGRFAEFVVALATEVVLLKGFWLNWGGGWEATLPFPSSCKCESSSPSLDAGFWKRIWRGVGEREFFISSRGSVFVFQMMKLRNGYLIHKYHVDFEKRGLFSEIQSFMLRIGRN